MSLSVAILTTDKREHERRYTETAPSFGTAPEALLQGFALLPEVQVHVISCAQRPMQSPEKLAANIWYHSLWVPRSGWMRTLYQGCIRAVRKKLREIGPDIAHGQGTERDCALNAVFSGYPNVLTIHGNMRLVAKVEKKFYWRLAAQLERFTLPRSDGIVCITHYTQAAVAGPAKQTWVVPNAVDAGFFDLAPSPEPGAPPIILCVGAIGVRKNQNAFIRALDPLAARQPLQVLFFGSVSSDEPYGREFFQLLATRPWCRHLGFANRDTLKSHLKKTALLALPSLEDNCPMVVLEAMAAGVPVVAANVGGVPDLVEDGKTGLFCDPHIPESMAAAVEKMLSQPALAQAIAHEARGRAKERFHPKVVAARHLEIYREVVAARR